MSDFVIGHFSIVRLKIEYNPLLRQGVGTPSAEEKIKTYQNENKNIEIHMDFYNGRKSYR